MKKFYAQKDALGFPIPGTMMSGVKLPSSDLVVEIPAEESTAEYGQSVSVHPGKLRHFVRLDAKGAILPNSLTVSQKRPKGNVIEFKQIVGTALPTYSFSVFRALSSTNACAGSGTNFTLYAAVNTLTLGLALFTDNKLTQQVPDGWYKLAGRAWQVGNSDGLISNYLDCVAPTTTTTTTTAP